MPADMVETLERRLSQHMGRGRVLANENHASHGRRGSTSTDGLHSPPLSETSWLDVCPTPNGSACSWQSPPGPGSMCSWPSSNASSPLRSPAPSVGSLELSVQGLNFQEGVPELQALSLQDFQDQLFRGATLRERSADRSSSPSSRPRCSLPPTSRTPACSPLTSVTTNATRQHACLSLAQAETLGLSEQTRESINKTLTAAPHAATALLIALKRLLNSGLRADIPEVLKLLAGTKKASVRDACVDTLCDHLLPNGANAGAQDYLLFLLRDNKGTDVRRRGAKLGKQLINGANPVDLIRFKLHGHAAVAEKSAEDSYSGKK